MYDSLKKLLDKAYAPYSNFPVAAIVKTKDNKYFFGVNVENASFGGTICAERNALNSAIGAGYRSSDFQELHVLVNSTKHAYPCYLCRQTISELCNSDMIIKLYNIDNKVIEVKYDDLISFPFEKENLK